MFLALQFLLGIEQMMVAYSLSELIEIYQNLEQYYHIHNIEEEFRIQNSEFTTPNSKLQTPNSQLLTSNSLSLFIFNLTDY